MPSYDSTGKRLSGSKQKKKAAEAAAARAKLQALAPELVAVLPGGKAKAPPPAPGGPCPLKVEPPPYDQGVGAGMVWLARVQAAAAVLAARGGEPARVRAVNICSKAAGSMRVAAVDSEHAVRLAGHFAQVSIPVTEEAPPEDPAGLSLWGFWRLCALAHDAATTLAEIDDAQVSHRARALALLSAVQPQDSIDRWVKAAEKAADVAPLRAVA